MMRALVAAATAVPSLAIAHAGGGESHGLLAGFMHPLLGVDHVLAMVAVGVFAAQLGGRSLWAIPLTFVAAMTIAASFGMGGLALPGLEAAIALSVIVLGGVISLRLKPPVTLAVAMIAVFAIFHGYSHGLEGDGNHSSIAFGLGFIAATALLHLTGIGFGLAVPRLGVSRGDRIARAGGNALVLAGVLLFAGSLG